MKSRFRKLAVESLEGRSMMSATAFADFNNDGLLDMAAVTNPTTVTVSLANLDGSYTVSAVLTAPKSQPVQDVVPYNIGTDGNMDIMGLGSKKSGSYSVLWQNNGDGTFSYVEPFKWKPNKWFI